MIIRFRKLLISFSQDSSGLAAIVFVMMIVPIMLVVGGAIDYSNARSQQENLQNTLDSATLAGARALANSMYVFDYSAEQREQADLPANESVEDVVKNYFAASWPNSVTLPEYKVEIIDNKDVQVVFATPVVVKTNMLGIFGISEMPAITKAVATIVTPALDFAIMADSSDSMGKNGKLDNLKSEILTFFSQAEKFNSQGLDPHDMIWISLTAISRSTVTTSWSLTMNIPGLYQPVYALKRDGNTALGRGVDAAAEWLYKSERRSVNSGYNWATGGKYQYLIVLSDGDEDAKLGPFVPACQRAKANGVQVLVVIFPPERGGDTERMQQCAGNPKNVYSVGGRNMNAMFYEILTRIKTVRLKQ